ncbi:hypothetical protein CDEF62S_04168 [Castellaniella defragrans]
MPDPLLIAQNTPTQAFLIPSMANRHGCITGATGTGKTITLQVLAESFSRSGRFPGGVVLDHDPAQA